MKDLHVLVVVRSDDALLARLKAAVPGADIVTRSVKVLTDEDVARADAIVGNLPERFFPALGDLKLLQLNSAGVAAPYLRLMRDRPGLTVCCASGAYGPAISEHMVGALLMLMKRLHQYRVQQRSGQWIDRGDVVSPVGRTVLAVGLGDIGTHFAGLMTALGARVIGVRRRPSAPPAGVQEVITLDRLDEALPGADIVALSLPDTPQTRGLMDARRLQLMKPGSYLLNVGRGTAVDADALAGALASGHLAGAAIDVTEPEPLPPEHPLWQQENALITPHISGNFHLRRTLELIYDIAAHNLKALAEGGRFRSRVDAEAGYRE